MVNLTKVLHLSAEPDVLTEVTSRNLYTVLNEIHQNLVRRDPRGIFANPVTDDIAVGYSEVISKPMDLGTICSRLRSRAYYRSAAEYLADVTLMCDNAMVYNPPDTIYFQRARKLLSFCRKQMSLSSLQKAGKDLPGGLTAEEIGDLMSVENQMSHMIRMKAFIRSSKIHSNAESEFRTTGSDSKFGLSPKYRSDSNRNVVVSSQSSIVYPVHRKRGRPRSHLSTTSRYQIHLNRKPLKNLSHISSEQHAFRDDVKSKHSIESRVSSSSSSQLDMSSTYCSAPPKEIQSTPKSGTSRSFPVQSPVVITPQKRGRGRPRKIRLDDLQPPVCSANLNVSSELQDSSILSQTSTLDIKVHPDSVSAISRDQSHSENSMIIKSENTQSEYDNCIADSIIKAEPDCDSNTENFALMSKAPSTASSSPLSGSSCKTFNGKASLISKKQRFMHRDNQSNKHLSHFKVDNHYKYKDSCVYSDRANSVNDDDDSVYNDDSCDESSDRLHYRQTADNLSSEILLQAKKAAAESAAKLKRKYANITSNENNVEYIGPKIVCLNCTTEGEVSAIECRNARSNTISSDQKLPNKTDDTVTSEETTKPEKIQKISYPPLLIDLLTKQKALNIPKMDDYSMTQQNEILDKLHKLKCNSSDEPIATAIHGPLTIFSPMQLVQLSEVFSSDPSLIEYAVSLLKFVQPVGRWARRWVAKRLDAATDGLHSQAIYALQSQYDNDKTELLQSWFDKVDLTIDPPTPKSDEVDTEHLEPCLLDLLMDDDTVTSCNNNTNGPILSTDNEHISLISDVQISCIKNENINFVNTSNSPNPIDVTLTADSCETSFYNTSVSASEVTVSAPNSTTIIPQQNSSLNNELNVIICDSIPSSVSASTSCDNITAHSSDTQSTGQVPLVATKPSEGQALSDDECASNVKVADDVVCSNFSSSGDLKSDCFVHAKSEQTSEAPSDSSTSLLKTALSAASSYSLTTSHDRIVVQNKVISNAGEDITKNFSSNDCLPTTMPTTSLQHSLFLDSHLITHKEIRRAVETHAENNLPVNQIYDTTNYAEANSSTVCQLQNSCVRICVDMDASSTSSTDTDNANSRPLLDLISSDISQTNPETNVDNTSFS
uniref:Bromo domain-containing protein n=1 Tax=Trichobilharzia regenti TaxID=157069 RepID=A0AA85JQK1_TRIRE|nr:unnamed protein product [Trichobilharzia regenti]